MSEQEEYEDERRRVSMGAAARDLSEKSAWRQRTDLCVMEALDVYGTYLGGQTNGWSDALSLPAVVAALDLEGVPENERPDLARRLIQIHSAVVSVAETRRRKAKAGGSRG